MSTPVPREAQPSFTLTRLEAPLDQRMLLARDAREGLSARPKRLPPRWFYDERGCRLFEEITRLPEYYLTRAEEALLARIAARVMASVRPSEIVELGSGSSRKTNALLAAMRAVGSGDRYVAFDCAEESIRQAARALQAQFAWLSVDGVVGDFACDVARIPRGGRRLVAFLGSTVGNLDEAERAAFFGSVGELLHEGDRLLLGVDLVKDGAVLHAAYDDAQGVTARFNLNMLSVMNAQLGAAFPLDAFLHVARWVPERSRIEMHLRALRALEVPVPGAGVVARFAEGEEMLTEISCKFTRDGVASELGDAGLRVESWDDDTRFALLVAARA